MDGQWVLLVPFLWQGAVIALDEGFFHLRRGLPQWERIGHPIDTASVLACLLVVVTLPLSPTTLALYVCLALFSCGLVTKDEFVHKECCPATEQWLHAVLFINHPVLLTALGLLWGIWEGVDLPAWLPTPAVETVGPFLWTQVAVVTTFMLYQIIYWNFVWTPVRQHLPSTTPSTTN